MVKFFLPVFIMISATVANAGPKVLCPRGPQPEDCSCSAFFQKSENPAEKAWESRKIKSRAEFQECALRNNNLVGGKVDRFDGNFTRYCKEYFCVGHEADGEDSMFHQYCNPRAAPSRPSGYFCSYTVHIYKNGNPREEMIKCEHSPNAGNTQNVSFPGSVKPEIAKQKAAEFCSEKLVGELGYAKCEPKCNF